MQLANRYPGMDLRDEKNRGSDFPSFAPPAVVSVLVFADWMMVRK